MDTVSWHDDQGICTITLNRPECRNAIDRDTADALRACYLRFERTAHLKVAIITGAGGHFCAGADLKAVGDPAKRRPLDAHGLGTGPLGPTRLALSKPLIAAIEGYAVAGGLELALQADMRVAASNAALGVFCRRWGVPLIDGGTVRLPRIVGMGRALDMILTGREVGAEEALAMGLVNRVVAPGESLAAAQQLAAQIAAFPQGCMLADRASAYAQWDLPLAQALQQEGVHGAPIVALEGRAGAARFASGAGRHGKF